MRSKTFRLAIPPVPGHISESFSIRSPDDTNRRPGSAGGISACPMADGVPPPAAALTVSQVASNSQPQGGAAPPVMERAVVRHSSALISAVIVLLASPAGQAAEPPAEIMLSGHIFTPAEIHIKAGQPIVLHVRNQDATAEEFESGALKIEKVIAGHAEATIRLRPLAPGTYKFVGEYHEDTAHGVVVAE